MIARPPSWILITIMAAVIVLLVVILAVSTAGAETPAQVRGIARVVDGDTIRIGEHRIRLFGINAPEIGSEAGEQASRLMQTLSANKSVVCNVMDTDRWQRLVAQCYVGGSDLGAAMVALGWAVNYDRYTSIYESYELWARTQCHGMWTGQYCWKGEGF